MSAFLTKLLLLSTLATGLALPGCSTNPVTGESELSLLSEDQEVQIGSQQYGPAVQSQGGDYDEVDPELSAYVNEVGQRLAAVSDRELPYEFVVLNNDVPNAWALPGGKIALNRGLLVELDNEAELAAVLGHEIVHAAARHGAQAVTRGTLLQGALVAGMIAASDSEYADFIVGGAQLGAQLINQRYGRDAEREADYYGIQYMLRAGYDPNAAVSLQETFVRLSEGRNPGWLEGLFASHPPSQERVENNRELVRELQPQIAGRDLELGRERYQQQIAFIRQAQPAYDLFNEAQQDITEEDFDAALDKLRRANDMVPSEAKFIGLAGDVHFYRRDYDQAIENYDLAIEMDPDYFDYYLGRGVSYKRLGSVQQARDDLRHSAELLPTELAMNELGEIALAANDIGAAREYFGMAAQGQGPVAAAARRSFVRLDIGQNPGNYVQAQAFTDDSGRVYVRVGNQSGVDLANVQVQIGAITDGRQVGQSRVIRSLPAGQAVDIASGLTAGPTTSQIGAAVVAAQVQ